MLICYVACSLNQLAQLVTVLSVWLSVFSSASSFISSRICFGNRHRLPVSPCSVYRRCQSSISTKPAALDQWLCLSASRITGNIMSSHWIEVPGKHRQDLIHLQKAGSEKTRLMHVRPQPNPWTVHVTHSAEGEAQATVVVVNNPNFCQQLIIPKTGIKASTASLKHLKERYPRSKPEYWDWTSQPFQYWTQHEVYFILAANVKRCVKAGLSTMRKCTTREDGTRGRDGGLQLPRSSAICLLRFWCFFAASQSLTPKSKHALKNALWENTQSACFLV